MKTGYAVMTFDELQERMGQTLVEDDWHRHVNGGGWVRNDSEVTNSVVVTDEAIVAGGICTGAAIIKEQAIVRAATVGEQAILAGQADLADGGIATGLTYLVGPWSGETVWVAAIPWPYGLAAEGVAWVGCRKTPHMGTAEWWTENVEALAAQFNADAEWYLRAVHGILNYQSNV